MATAALSATMVEVMGLERVLAVDAVDVMVAVAQTQESVLYRQFTLEERRSCRNLDKSLVEEMKERRARAMLGRRVPKSLEL